MFSTFGLKPPASGFQSYSYSSLKTSPYSTDDKTSRLMVKRFSIVGKTQRDSQSYMEKRKGRGEIETARRRRGGIKRGESNLASNQFLFCSPQSNTQRGSQSSINRRGRKEIEVIRRRRGEVKRRETNLVCDQFPTCSPQPGTPKHIHKVK